ncbi:MAG: DUF4401 domain-containing protein [Planctomycetes bacterium]|nr:DUF4401 domain-containing protein [Planctomycetota bacterium]
MAKSTTTDLLRRLRADGHIEQRDLEAICTRAGSTSMQPKALWYLQVFLLFGALIAGILCTAGFAAIFRGDFTDTAMLGFGAFYIGVAVALHRLTDNLFLSHLALALSIGGHGFFLFGVSQKAGHDDALVAIFLGSLVLCAALYPIYRMTLHRTASCVLVFVLAKIASNDPPMPIVCHVLVAVATATSAWILARRRCRPALMPLAYGCVIGLVILTLPISERGLWFEEFAMQRPWIASIVLAVALLFALHRAAPDGVRTQARLAIIVVGGVLALAVLTMPGILAALFLAVLGHAMWHPIVAWIGLGSLPIALWHYFYSLDQTYAQKSMTLVASGVLLLAARFVMSKSGNTTTTSASRGDVA